MKKALIIGGGIAGPVTAMALQKAGWEPVVYEAYEDAAAEQIGAYLTVAVNGLSALAEIDAHHLVMNVGHPTDTLSFYTSGGKHITDMPIGGTLPDGTVTHSVKRRDLYRALNAEAVRRGIRYEFGKRLVDARPTAGHGVVATFADGSRAEGDLLVGADGIRSRTREIIDPTAPQAHYLGIYGLGGFVTDPDLHRELGLRPGVYNMIFGKKAFFGYLVAPTGEIWWFANMPGEQELSKQALTDTSPAQWREELMRLLAADRGPAARIVAATPDAGFVTGFNQYDMPSVATWHTDSMVIIGDAAHAVASSSGQGVSMAVEDAVTLALCLRDQPDTASALAEFEHRRRDRVEKVVAHGAETSGDKAQNGVARLLVRLLTPFFLKRAAKQGVGSLNWMFDHRISWSDAAEQVHAGN
ncbi:FAD-dependent monooxygenase [Nocardia tengchongensis]|uniref:FAD-dependent monooxygenase n=1 Tax=Nocardia tengchongensis TaxID=2055889 RepID=A0ABX8CPV1_9NOCA|nr:FAD-dependent monooxygenase [Nocardia tengchongensis]QVI21038.1 FAD-dependent monooxygenase [Nocardia tengchongensis]